MGTTSGGLPSPTRQTREEEDAKMLLTSPARPKRDDGLVLVGRWELFGRLIFTIIFHKKLHDNIHAVEFDVSVFHVVTGCIELEAVRVQYR
jgi:hypothetical protein